MRSLRLLLPAAGLLAVLASLPGAAGAPPDGGAVVVDANDREHKLTAYKWLAGTRHLTWLDAKDPVKAIEPPDETKKGPPMTKGPTTRPAVGPLAFEFREVESTTYVNGVVTLIPLDRLRKLEFDAAMKTATAVVAPGGKDEEDVTLTGSTQFKGFNQPALEAEIDRGPMGVAALKFLGGTPTGGIKSVAFPVKKGAEEKPGRASKITIVHDKKKVEQTVTDLKPLYQYATGAEVVAPAILFRKTLKVELGNVLKIVNANPGQVETTLDVTFKDDTTETLTAWNTVKLDGKDATLVGFVARVPAGWRIYPLHTVAEAEVAIRVGVDARPGLEQLLDRLAGR